MSNMFTFPKPTDLTKSGDQVLGPNGLWFDIPADCIGQPVDVNIIRRPVTEQIIETDAIEIVREIRALSKNISALLGIEWKLNGGTETEAKAHPQTKKHLGQFSSKNGRIDTEIALQQS